MKLVRSRNKCVDANHSAHEWHSSQAGISTTNAWDEPTYVETRRNEKGVEYECNACSDQCTTYCIDNNGIPFIDAHTCAKIQYHAHTLRAKIMCICIMS